ncbi:MAG: GTP cyclohydrolase II [Deltaproteobacteria bacterium]|nr:GTP cyclohydrolase II [Deltaproteobacteria bacterium]MBW2214142.1 GTP cyclohydrolase II [Deltaproteobacteria bacterium]MBW2550089.1 GTP cyclohydrolase II [Deltaproteobacteria bacterium]MBW2628571.1 GTP cyclohydrolase II [Deltaproteobacteria bacterium]RLB42831.1 MAG: GTP cyclohydrolase II [Deltaproteobacteria bacterium]
MSDSSEHKPTVERYAAAELPSRFGPFRVVVYREIEGGKEHLAVIAGDIEGAEDLLIRVHSECLTGEALHSLRCDCRDQLDLALERIQNEGTGAVIYLRQEGRGIGLGNKIRAYAKQDEGLDTVDANLALGFEDDQRGYQVAADMLRDLGVGSVALMTNNPRKVQGLESDGIKVTRREPHEVEVHDHNRDYLKTKQDRLGHLGTNGDD